MPKDVDDIYRIQESAERLLEEVQKVFLNNEVDLPARQYLAVGGRGSTAHDEEQVTVGISTSAPGIPFANRPSLQKCSDPYQADFVVEIVRCTPQQSNTSESKYDTAKAEAKNAPSADAMTEYAKRRMIDVWLLSKAARNFGAGSIMGTANYFISTGQESGAVQGVSVTITGAV